MAKGHFDGFVALEEISPLYLEAQRVLAQLIDTEGLDWAHRAFAAVARERYKKEFARQNGLTQSHGHVCINRLVGRHCNHLNGDCRPPGCDDHSTLWLKDARPFAYVAQPYDMDMADVKALVSFCEKRHLDFRMDAWPSWHFPGRTLTVEIRRREAG